MIDDVLNFWFLEIDPSAWWKKDEAFDQHIRHRFSSLHTQAANCELYEWRNTATGRLAEIIILDQFSRNIYRDTPLAFAQDALALALAQECIHQKIDAQLTPPQRSFVYMPYMHSESLTIHSQALTLFESLGNENNLEFEIQHKDIIEKFGRYPHRNTILGRQSTEDEIAFLKQPGSGF